MILAKQRSDQIARPTFTKSNSIMTRILHFLSLFLGLLTTTISQAQSWCPPGAEWISKPFFTGAQGSSRYYYVGDTMLGGRTGQRLAWDYAERPMGSQTTYVDHSDTKIITSYEDGIVSIWVADSSAWDTLFWFSAMPGDRWHRWNEQFIPGNPTDWIAVQDTGSIVVDGTMLRQLHVVQVCEGFGTDTTYAGTITERIGYFTPFDFPEGCASVDGLWELACYNDSLIHYTTGQPCDILTNMNESSLGASNLFPNPGKDQFTIQLPNGSRHSELMLWDATGRLVLQWPIASDQTALDTRQLLPGPYAYRIRSASGEVLGQGQWVKW